MSDPDWDAACPGCTASVDALPSRVLAHLRSRDTAFTLVSRTPLARLEAYRAARSWTAPWHSSLGTGFNCDFQVTPDKSAGQVLYNYRDCGPCSSWPGAVTRARSANWPGRTGPDCTPLATACSTRCTTPRRRPRTR